MKKIIFLLLIIVTFSSCIVVQPRHRNYVRVHSNGHYYPIRTYNNPPISPFWYGWLWW